MLSRPCRRAFCSALALPRSPYRDFLPKSPRARVARAYLGRYYEDAREPASLEKGRRDEHEDGGDAVGTRKGRHRRRRGRHRVVRREGEGENLATLFRFLP